MFLTQEEEKSGTVTPESTGVDATPDTDKKEETYQVIISDLLFHFYSNTIVIVLWLIIPRWEYLLRSISTPTPSGSIEFRSSTNNESGV